MTIPTGVIVVAVVFGVPILSGVLYGLLLRLGYDPVDLTGGNIDPADEPLKAAVDVKHERAAKRVSEDDE